MERREELAQAVKGDRIKQRIRIVNSDKVYSRSPEVVAVENIYRERVNRTERNFYNELSEKSKKIYDMKDEGSSFTDISKVVNIHVSNVSRNYYKSMDKLKQDFLKVIGEERENDS